MLSVNGTTNYSTARIDGVIFTDSNTEIQQIKEDITDITYNDITDTTNIDNNVAITKDLNIGGDATISGTLNINALNLNDLIVSNNISTDTLDASGNITTKSDLMIYDKRTPTPIPYKWTTDSNNHLKLTYQPSLTTYTLFDATVDAFNVSQLTLPRFTTLSSGMLLPSTQHIYWDNTGTGASISYNASTKLFQIESGLNASTTNIISRDGAGTAYNLNFNASRLKVPVNLELDVNRDLVFDAGTGKINQTNSTGTNTLHAVTIKADNNVTQSGTGVITQSGTGSNTLKQTLISGTNPIEIIPSQPPNTPVATRNAVLLFKNSQQSAGLVLEQSGGYYLMSYGINVPQVGTRTASIKGALFRLDTRPAEPVFSVFTYAVGFTTSITAFGINDNGTALFNGDLTTQNINMAINRNLTQSGTGIISQTGTGINQLKATIFTGDVTITGGVIGGGDKAYRNEMNMCEDITFLTENNTGFFSTFIKPKCMNCDPANANLLQTATINVNTCVVGVVKVFQGETYTGIVSYIEGAVNVRCALYNVGTSAALLAEQTSTWTTTSADPWERIPFTTPYTSNATKYVAIMLVPVSTNITSRIFNIGSDCNWQRVNTISGKIDILSGVFTGFTGFANPFNRTMTAATSKYVLGLY